MKKLMPFVFLAFALAASGCVGTTTPVGTIHLVAASSHISDSNIASATVTITRVDLHAKGAGNDEASFVNVSSEPVAVDLTLLQDDVLLDVASNASIPAGQYDAVRVFISGGQVVAADGTVFNFVAPAEDSQGLFVDLIPEVNLDADLINEISLGFDADATFVATTNGYAFSPALTATNLSATIPTTAAKAKASAPGADGSDMNGAPEHVHLQKGYSRSGGGHGSSPLMTYHNGGVLVTNKTMAIFWGAEWANATFVGDKIVGIDSFFQGLGGSEYGGTGNEYSSANGAYVTSSSTYLGHSIDTTAAPTKALSTSTAVAEACKVIGNNPDPSALYLIYTSTGAGHVNYCAWHSWGTCSNGMPIQVAYMPNIDGIAGCDPQDTSGLHSQGLAALANVTAHETMETITDPRGAGWFDSSGNENGDKCAWSFPPALETLSNSTQWKLQMEWSNAAYSAGTGLANSSGQLGCIY